MMWSDICITESAVSVPCSDELLDLLCWQLCKVFASLLTPACRFWM